MSNGTGQQVRQENQFTWIQARVHRELFKPTMFFWAGLLWQELWVKVFCVQGLTAENMAVTALLLLPLALLLGGMCAAVSRRRGRVLLPAAMGVITLWVGAQIAYYSLFRTYLSLYSVTQAGMVLNNFGMDAVYAVLSNWAPLLLVLAPFGLSLVLRDRILMEKDTLSRAALLVNLALDQAAEDWENIYTVTAFFAGASDDLGYYEYAPAIREAYGGMPAAADLPAREEEYQSFKALVEKLDPPAINSVPVWDDPQDTADAQEVLESKKGFRFMGQRFSIDAAVFQQLVYRAVDPAPGDQKRLLPDFLDLPAALGSDTALELLEQQGVTEYPNYLEQMEKLRTSVEQAPASSWGASLSSGWLYTLLPVLEPKGEGWPSYRTSVQWQKKNLETFAGSYTELKHDTVLYAKQVMGEMGGGMIEEVDDRGYVDPEAEVYRRFALLAQQTSEGLDRLGYLEEADRENLSRLAELARQLETISEKELKNQTLTEEEYELIRGYGGSLEHFWLEAVKDRVGEEYFTAQEIPSSLVTDIATDPNGLVLQLANARPSELLVVVPVDGTLRLACGAVYDFYQFVQPMEQRLTDEEWREQIGQWAGPYGRNPDAQVEKPWWTLSYWSAE